MANRTFLDIQGRSLEHITSLSSGTEPFRSVQYRDKQDVTIDPSKGIALLRITWQYHRRCTNGYVTVCSCLNLSQEAPRISPISCESGHKDVRLGVE
jgi:hypothetical protein